MLNNYKMFRLKQKNSIKSKNINKNLKETYYEKD
jgi:hypothetical protein